MSMYVKDFLDNILHKAVNLCFSSVSLRLALNSLTISKRLSTLQISI